MSNSKDNVMLTTASGFQVHISYEMSTGSVWVKDISSDEWYFNSVQKGWNFERLVVGEACHQIRKGEDVKDEGLLTKLREAKKQYIDTYLAG